MVQLSCASTARAAALLGAAAVIVSSCGGAETTREAAEALPIRDDFEGECPWPQETSANDEVSCAEGQYKVLIKTARNSSWIPRRTQEGYRSVSVSAEATQLVPPGSGESTLQGLAAGHPLAVNRSSGTSSASTR